MRILILAILAAALHADRAHAATLDIREGLWEITVKMEMTGMPAGVPAQALQRCLTRKDVDDPRNLTPAAGGSAERCQFSDYTLQGNTATWSWTCAGEGAMTGSSTITFSQTSYRGTSRMAMKHTGPVKSMVMHYTGRRLGDCAKN
jgi:hypothetical protein